MTRLKIFQTHGTSLAIFRVQGPSYVIGGEGQCILKTTNTPTAHAPFFRFEGAGQALDRVLVRGALEERIKALLNIWAKEEGGEPGTIFLVFQSATPDKAVAGVLAVGHGWKEGPPTLPDDWWLRHPLYRWDETRRVGQVQVGGQWEDLILPPISTADAASLVQGSCAREPSPLGPLNPPEP